MSRRRVSIFVDGAYHHKRGGWGVVIVANKQEWHASGNCAAWSSDEVEFTAALNGLIVAERLTLLCRGIQVHLFTDSLRLIHACRDRKVRVYSGTDLERLSRREHVLSDVCLAARKEILRFGHNVNLRLQWIKRSSRVEQLRADKLSKFAIGATPHPVAEEGGLSGKQFQAASGEPNCIVECFADGRKAKQLVFVGNQIRK
ncbi:MAG: hypothetical protein JO061_15830 [Acidobacteriaceae bacterium]|nr:hypothetical protein [Acidobacteriaceae bacterium]